MEPPATKRLWPVRVGLAALLALYLGYSSFGIAHPVLWGHMGHHEAEYMMRVRTTFRQHLVTPATHAGYDVPPWNDYYFHHPIGYHHVLGAWTLLLGDHLWTPTTLPVATGLLLIWALFALVRRWWSREAALLAVAVWVGLPIVWSFSILTDAMFPAMACSLLTCHAYLSYTEQPSRRWLLIALAAQFVGGMLFWEAYLQAFLHGCMVLGWGKKTGRWRAAWIWFGATAAMGVSTMAFHFVFLWKQGMWADFFSSFQMRHNASAAFIFERHSLWLQILYGWPLVALGFVWLGLFAFRLLTGRARKRDQAVLTFFAINVLYICAFAEGSSLHLYRVFWFSSFLTLAVVDLAGDLRRLLARFGRPIALAAVSGALLVYFAVETRHAYANLLESRVMMGTHGLPGYNADYSKQLFAMEVAKRTGPEDFVFVHDNLPHRVEFWYYVDRSNRLIRAVGHLPGELKLHPRAVVLLDALAPPLWEKRQLYGELKVHPGTVWDRFLMLDERDKRPAFREFTFVPDPPDWKWRWFVSHRYPPMHAVETASMLSACVAAGTGVPPPKDAPVVARPTLVKPDVVTCYHNYNVVRGKQDVADAWLEELLKQSRRLDVKVPWGKLVALRNPTRTGVEVWMKIDRAAPTAPPKTRWLLQRIPAPPREWKKPEPAVPTEITEAQLGDNRPGYLYAQRLTWTVPPGKYRLLLESGLPHPSTEIALLDVP